MSGSTALDVRLPIGALFTTLGVLLTGYGLAASQAARSAASLSVNINLWWGLVMLVFGILMLLGAGLGRRKQSVRSAREMTEGRATETRERQHDLER